MLFITTSFFSCGISKEVKEGSSTIRVSQELFARENLKFYSMVKQTLHDVIDYQITDAGKLRDNAIAEYKNTITAMNKKVTENPAFNSDEKTLKIVSNERKLTEKTLEYKEKAKNTIEKQSKRKEKLDEAILILVSMQTKLLDATIKLDEYIQLKKAHETIFNELKSIFPNQASQLDKLNNVLINF